jgi:hypothetical protein
MSLFLHNRWMPHSLLRNNVKVSQIREMQDIQQINSQKFSPLLTKLPLEVRQEIYKYILLGWGRSPIVHIHEMKMSLRHYRCQIENEDLPCNGTHPNRNTSCVMLWHEFEARTEIGWERRMKWYVKAGMADNLLPILQTCRKL